MNGRNLLIDSNIGIYLAKGQLDPVSFILPDDNLYISDVTFMEVLGYAFSDAQERIETETPLSIFLRVPIEEPIVQKVIDLRQVRKMKLPDTIIAATAMVRQCALATRNIADFSGNSKSDFAESCAVKRTWRNLAS